MASNDAVPAEPKTLLPRVWRHACWHNASGLVVSPFTRTLPPKMVKDPASDKPKDYLNPRHLRDDNICLAFFPRKPIHHGLLFSVLAVSREQLEQSINAVPSDPPQYTLSESLKESWSFLEQSLVGVALTLLTSHPNAKSLPRADIPLMPSYYGYKDYFTSKAAALASVKQSREAYRMLSAFTTFALTLWLTQYEESCFDEAFAVLAGRAYDPVPEVWLGYLRQSIVCDLSPGLRPGGFLDPFQTKWGCVAHRFARAGVPVWFLWGFNWKTIPLVDPGMKVYIPRDDVVETAKQRQVVYSEISLPHVVLPTSATYSFQPDPQSTIPPTGPLPPLYDEVRQSLNEDLDTPPPPGEADPSSKDSPYTLQRSGESWEAFFERMKQSHKDYLARETDPRKQQSRESREQHAKTSYSRKSKFFWWEEDNTCPGYYRRRPVLKSDVDDEWSNYTPHQRFYWSHLDQWDLCSHLPRQPEGAPPALTDAELEDMDVAEDFHSVEESLTNNSEMGLEMLEPLTTSGEEGPEMLELLTTSGEEGPGRLESVTTSVELGPGMLAAVRAGVAREVSPPADGTQWICKPFTEYLRERHGFRVSRIPGWFAENHIPRSNKHYLPSTRGLEVCKRLQYGPEIMTLNDQTLMTIVDWYNTAANLPVLYKDLPPSWDISRYREAPRLYFGEAIRLMRIRDPARKSVYLLRTQCHSPWFIITASATAVLLAYRNQWTTMNGIGRGFLSRGIPFRTVWEVDRVGYSEKSWRGKSRGLGLRPHGFQAREEEFLAYEEDRDEILRSPCGRAVRLLGGIVGRIASEVVTDDEVLDGPMLGNEIVGSSERFHYVDDGVDTESLDIVSGVFHVATDDRATSYRHDSFWPKQSTWVTTGYHSDQWTPGAEQWYTTRRTALRAGKVDVHNASVWKAKLKLSVKTVEAVLGGSEAKAAKFLRYSSRSPLL